MDSDCLYVGSTNPDIAGLGGCRSCFPYGRYYYDGDALRAVRRILSNVYRRNESSWVIRKRIIDDLLLTISDTQTVNGLSLLIAGLAQYKSLSLYHMHIIYDTVNFTAISMCGGLANVFGQDKKSQSSRLCVFFTFGALYLAFSIIFATKLHSWDLSGSSQCYSYRLIGDSVYYPPSGGLIYLGCTCCWCLWVLICCGSLQSSSICKGYQEIRNRLNPFLRIRLAFLERLAASIVLLATLQYSVHLYMVIALRISNEGNLSGDSENTWGFGQIVALLTAFSTLIECVRGYSDYVEKIKQLEEVTDTGEAAGMEEAREVNAEGRAQHEGPANRTSAETG
ncbi:unnamed protein product [Clonostachys rhizophaga]|uniref:Transmembrane protein n=1 Tax=Clonostachys rhizophaga TaxID=160324 RepID=A0A9N9YQS1_9HYPO|nr:unnamed protein product [Clonostachys rhizophaga]